MWMIEYVEWKSSNLIMDILEWAGQTQPILIDKTLNKVMDLQSGKIIN